MLGRAKRLFRRWFPRKRDALLDDSVYVAPNDDRFARIYADVIGFASDEFTRERFEEGRRWRGVLRHYFPDGDVTVLDIGGGNGAIELALNADPRFKTVSVELGWNDDARKLGCVRVVADASRLPFRAASFDTVTCLETIEHVREPRSIGAEIARVTRAHGLLLLTTPPRWRYALRPDPHFGIRGLALLPSRAQRAVAARRGFRGDHHYVDRLYGSVAQIVRALAHFRVDQILSRSRAPRRWFWDAIVFRRVAR